MPRCIFSTFKLGQEKYIRFFGHSTGGTSHATQILKQALDLSHSDCHKNADMGHVGEKKLRFGFHLPAV